MAGFFYASFSAGRASPLLVIRPETSASLRPFIRKKIARLFGQAIPVRSVVTGVDHDQLVVALHGRPDFRGDVVGGKFGLDEPQRQMDARPFPHAFDECPHLLIILLGLIKVIRDKDIVRHIRVLVEQGMNPASAQRTGSGLEVDCDGGGASTYVQYSHDIANQPVSTPSDQPLSSLEPDQLDRRAAVGISQPDFAVLYPALQLLIAPRQRCQRLGGGRRQIDDGEIVESREFAVMIRPPQRRIAAAIAVNDDTAGTAAGAADVFFVGQAHVYPERYGAGQIL